jgi:hypothetical protein
MRILIDRVDRLDGKSSEMTHKQRETIATENSDHARAGWGLVSGFKAPSKAAIWRLGHGRNIESEGRAGTVQ